MHETSNGHICSRLDSQEMENEYSRNEQMHCDHSDMNSGTNIAQADQSDIADGNVNKVVTTKKIHSQGGVKSHLGKRLQDIEREPGGVGKSTVKRTCRNCGVDRWPSNEHNNRNSSLFVMENAVNQVQDGDAETSVSSCTNIPPLDLTVHQNKPHTNPGSTQQLAKISCPETDMMMVKAKFKDDTKFRTLISSGMEKLKEEVIMKLNLKIESLKIEVSK